MNFFDISTDITGLIYDFSGYKKMWMTRFTNDVLTKIDQGHKIVGIWHNGEDDVEGTPCGNCYIYAGTACGDKEFCMNCIAIEDEERQYTSISFAEYMALFKGAAIKVSIMDVFKTYEDFKRYRNIEKVRIDNFIPSLCANELINVLLKWEIKKMIKVVN